MQPNQVCVCVTIVMIVLKINLHPFHPVSHQFDRKLALAPGFVVPSNLDYQGYHSYVDEMMPHESPVHYGLNPNAEIVSDGDL